MEACPVELRRTSKSYVPFSDGSTASQTPTFGVDLFIPRLISTTANVAPGSPDDLCRATPRGSCGISPRASTASLPVTSWQLRASRGARSTLGATAVRGLGSTAACTSPVTRSPHLRARALAAVLACGSGFRSQPCSGRRAVGPGDRAAPTHGDHRPRAESGRQAGIRVHRVAPLHPADLRNRHGVRLTAPSRTVCDLAADLSGAQLEHLVQEATVRRLISDQQLVGALERIGRCNGVSRIREILAVERDGGFTRSGGERALARLIDGAGLPRPQRTSSSAASS